MGPVRSTRNFREKKKKEPAFEEVFLRLAFYDDFRSVDREFSVAIR